MVLASQTKQSPTIHSKKRHGQHHKVSKRYSKTYWPYLPMLLVVALGFVLNSLWVSPSKVLDYATSVSSSALLQGTNDQRLQQGLGSLALNNQLSQAAQSKANDMAARDYWSHVTPDGLQPWQFISSAGYSYTLAGENLAYGFATSADAIAGWMNSPGHRANILKPGYIDVGFGIANAPNYQSSGPQTIIVAMYASPAKVAAAPAPAQQSAPPAAPTTPPPSTPTPALPTTPAIPEPSGPAPPVQTPTQPAPKEAPKTQAAPAKEPTENLTSQPVSRLDVLTKGNGSWVMLTLAVLIALAAISFVWRHGKMWHRYLVEGEHFLIKHPLYDLAIVAAVVVSVILSQTSGFIH